MRSRSVALAGLTAATIAFLAGGVSPAQAAFTSKCQQGSTLAIGKSARVFSVKKNGIRRVYGCANGIKNRSYLGRRGGEGGVDVSKLAVHGPRVAYVRNAVCGELGCRQQVIVRDLKTRKDLSNSDAAQADGETKVTDIVLASKGRVAWIGEEGDPVSGRHVFARAPGQPIANIASGLNIVRGSLALAGLRLYWTQGGAVSVNLGA